MNVFLPVFVIALLSFIPTLLIGGEWYVMLSVYLFTFVILHPMDILLCWFITLFIDVEKPIKKQNPLVMRIVFDVLCVGCWYFGIRSEFTGVEKLPEGRFLFVQNHRAMYDPLIVIEKLRKHNIIFIAKPSIMKIPFIGRCAKAAGFMKIDREDRGRANETVDRAIDYIRRDMCSIGVYPEGTRSKDATLAPFHPTTFRIAKDTGVPIVVSAISGSENIKHNAPFRKTPVKVAILEVIPAEVVAEKTVRELADMSHAIIAAHLGE